MMKWLLVAPLCMLAVVNSVVDAESRYLRTLADNTQMGGIPVDGLTTGAATSDLTSAQENTTLSVAQTTSRGLVDVVQLVPFDVQIAVTVNKGIQINEVANIVTAWMNEVYTQQLESFGYTEASHYAKFDSVVLFNNEGGGSSRRSLQSGGELFTAKFKGGAVFSRDATRTKPVPSNDVLLIQQVTLLNNDTALLERLQSSNVLELGSVVVDVNAFLNPVTQTANAQPEAQSSHLQILIIVAICVACVAFLFLLGAVIWAYRYDHAKNEAYLVKEHHPNATNPDRTDSDTAYENDSPERIRAVHVERSGHAYPAVIGGDEGDHGYPESVISDSIVSGSVVSEDISTSLSQYYRAGMGKVGLSSADYGRGGLLNDAGSVSSMESYGYSLDGGMSTPLPCDAPYQKERERIGGLPVEPDNLGDTYDMNMEEVQIPDLDKELANLDIKLSPNMEHMDMDVESYSHQDLEEYQMQDLEDMEALSQRSPVLLNNSSLQLDDMPDDELELGPGQSHI
jgi:hypothetical protein